MSFLCSCTRRRKNEDPADQYYYGKYSKYSSEVAPTPRVRRKFPGGVPVGPLPHAPSDTSIQKGEDFTWKHTSVVNNNTLGSDSDIEDIEKTLLSICEQEEERLRHSEVISQLDESSESESDSEDDDVASMTSQDLEDLLVTMDDPEDSSFSDDSDDVPEEPVNRFTLRPHDTLRERYAEYSNEIWKDIQVSLIEAVSSRHSGVQEREQTVEILGDNPVEVASSRREDTEQRQEFSDDTGRVFRAGRFQVTAVPDGNGACLSRVNCVGLCWSSGL
jgi:hypothetical protein